MSSRETASPFGRATPWHTSKGCLVVRVRVTPKSYKDAIEGIDVCADGPALRARVRAVPLDGDANAAVRALLAGWLGLSNSRITLVSGAKSRVKSFAISGEIAEIEAILTAKLDALTLPLR